MYLVKLMIYDYFKLFKLMIIFKIIFSVGQNQVNQRTLTRNSFMTEVPII